LFSDPDQFPGEGSRFDGRLLGLGWVALTTFRGLDYEGLGLGVEGLELSHVTVEFARVCTDQRVAFSHLGRVGQLGSGMFVWGVQTCAAGSGFQKTALRVSMIC